MYITTCRLTLQDNLFYASRETGRLYETERYLHNYGLCYALGGVFNLTKPYFHYSQVPTYQADLSRLTSEYSVYVTPAYPLSYSFTFNTFKMGEPAYYNLTSQTSSNRVLYGRAKELSPESQFRFYILSLRPLNLPRWVRLGKWMSKAALEVTFEGDFEAKVPSKPVSITCPLNPLDYSPKNLMAFDIISMPPVSLLVNALTQQLCYTFTDKTGRGPEEIHLPANLAFFSA